MFAQSLCWCLTVRHYANNSLFPVLERLHPAVGRPSSVINIRPLPFLTLIFQSCVCVLSAHSSGKRPFMMSQRVPLTSPRSVGMHPARCCLEPRDHLVYNPFTTGYSTTLLSSCFLETTMLLFFCFFVNDAGALLFVIKYAKLFWNKKKNQASPIHDFDGRDIFLLSLRYWNTLMNEARNELSWLKKECRIL